MLNKWDYSGVDEMCFSDSNQESYRKSAEFLGDTVEDWGCGTGWSKQYFKNYLGVDGSRHKNVDIVADLVEYTSNCDNVLMRQTLECNTEWKKILENVRKSFKKKFCLIVYTPIVEKTRVGRVRYADGTYSNDLTISEMYFNKQDILGYFPESLGYKIFEETIKTNQGYGSEWILYVEKIS